MSFYLYWRLNLEKGHIAQLVGQWAFNPEVIGFEPNCAQMPHLDVVSLFYTIYVSSIRFIVLIFYRGYRIFCLLLQRQLVARVKSRRGVL